MERIPSKGIAAKHVIAMKLSTEAIVALAVAVVFGLLSVGAIAREQGQSSTAHPHNGYIATNNAHLSRVAATDTDVLGFY